MFNGKIHDDIIVIDSYIYLRVFPFKSKRDISTFQLSQNYVSIIDMRRFFRKKIDFIIFTPMKLDWFLHQFLLLRFWMPKSMDGRWSSSAAPQKKHITREFSNVSAKKCMRSHSNPKGMRSRSKPSKGGGKKTKCDFYWWSPEVLQKYRTHPTMLAIICWSALSVVSRMRLPASRLEYLNTSIDGWAVKIINVGKVVLFTSDTL